MTGLFARYPDRVGRNWLKALPEDERKAFGHIGYNACLENNVNIHSIGGKVSAKKASRIPKGQPNAGRFAKAPVSSVEEEKQNG